MKATKTGEKLYQILGMIHFEEYDVVAN